MTYPYSSPTPSRYALSRIEVPVSGVVSAGGAIDPTPFVRDDRLYIPDLFLRPGTALYQVSGHSMDDGTERAIRDSEHVLVDTHDMLTRYDGVYAFQDAWGAYIVKRLNLHRGRRALLSNNTDFAPITQLHGYRMIGRVYAIRASENRFRWVR